MEDIGPTGTTQGNEVDPGFTGPTQGIELDSGFTGPTSLPLLSIADLLADQSVLQTKEQADARRIEIISALSPSELKPILLQWARAGFPAAYQLRELEITAPAVCSDGVSRSLADYIVFCSGKTIHDVVGEIQSRLADIEVSFYTTGSTIWIVVSRKVT